MENDGFTPDEQPVVSESDGFTPDAKDAPPPLVAGLPAEEHAIAYRAAIGRHLLDPSDPVANKVLKQQEKLGIVPPEENPEQGLPLDKPFSMELTPKAPISAEQQLEATHPGLEDYVKKVERPAAAAVLQRQALNIDPHLSREQIEEEAKIANGEHGPMARAAGEGKDLALDLAKKAWNNVLHPSDSLSGRLEQLKKAATTKDGPGGWEAIKKLPAEALAGIAEGGDQIVDLGSSVGTEAADLFADAVNKLGIAKDQSSNIAKIDAQNIITQRDTNAKRKEAAANLGLSPDDPVVKAIGTGLSIGLTAPAGGPSLSRAADAVVNAGTRTAIGTVRGAAGAADAAIKATPAAVAAYGGAHFIGHGAGWIAPLVEMAGLSGYLPRSGKAIVSTLADATTGHVKRFAQALLDQPGDELLTKKVGSVLNERAQRLADQLASKGEEMSSKINKMTGDSYTFKAGDEGLSKGEQDAIRLRDKINGLRERAAFFNSDTAQTVNRAGKNVVKGAIEGGAVGTAFGGLNVEPGSPDNTQMLEESGKQGALIGGLMSPLAMDAETKQLNVKKLQDIGAKALPADDPAYALHNENKMAMPEANRDFVDRIAGLAQANGNKTVLLSPDQFESMHGTKSAGAFDPNTKTLYLNTDYATQAGGHELGHAVAQALGFADPKTKFGAAVDRMIKENPQVQPRTNYENALANDVVAAKGGQRGDKGFIMNSGDEPPAKISLTPKELKDEAIADLGHRLIRDIGPEGYFGGRSVDQKLGAVVKGAVPYALRPDTAGGRFGFKISPEVRDMFQNELFDIGKRAKAGEARPDGGGIPLPRPAVKGDLGSQIVTAGSRGPLIGNAVDAMVALGHDKTTAKQRVDAAYNDLITGNLNKVPNVDEIVQGALKRGQPKPLMPASGYYSPLEKIIEDKMPNKASPEQVRAIISGGKKAEIDWNSPLRDLLDQGRTVTKEETLAAVKAGTPKVEVITKDDSVEPNDNPDSPSYDAGEQSTVTKFGQHVLPGGKNYKETLLTLPGRSPKSKSLEDYAATMAGINPELSRGLRQDNSRNFKSGHWDEPNVIGHIRTNDRVLSDGRKATHLEEVQSDWAQKIRAEGVSAQPQEMWVIRNESGSMVRRFELNMELEARKLAQEKQLSVRREPVSDVKLGVPDMPFRGEAWKRLLLRQGIKQAVEAGNDALTWTTGEQQESRYWGHELVAPAVERWKEVTKPQSIRELADNIFGRKVASMMSLNQVDGGMLSALHHDQIKSAVISELPVDVVDYLKGIKVSPKDLLSKPDMVVSGLPVDHRDMVLDGLLSASRSVGASLRTKLGNLSQAGGEEFLLPALKASDLNSREVASLLSPQTIFHTGDLGISPEKGTSAGSVTKSLPPESRGSFSDKLASTKLAELLNNHVESIHGHEGIVKQGFQPPPGEGMRGFYDRELPNIANDIGKKFGAKVEDAQIETAGAKAIVHALPITEKLRNAVSESGQPLFMPSQKEGPEGLSKAVIADKLGAIGEGEPKWSIRLRQLEDKAKTTPAEAKEELALHQQAKSEFGSYEKWFDKYAVKNYDAITGIGESVDKINRITQSLMPSGETKVNIGLNTNDGKGITKEEAIRALRAQGVKVSNISVRQSNTEPTLVASLDRPLTPGEANRVSAHLAQDAIAQHSDTGGELYGPKAESWKPFQKEHFLFMPSSHPDALSGPAIQMPDGEIYKGGMHAIAEDKALRAGFSEDDIAKATPGFVTNKGEFLDREEAMQRALEQKQIDAAKYDKSFKEYFNTEKKATGNLESASFRMSRAFMPASEISEIKAAEKKYNAANPDALPMRYKKGEDGKYLMKKGKPIPEQIPYGIMDTPEAKAVTKGVKGREAQREAVIGRLKDNLNTIYKDTKDDPEIAQARGWYKQARSQLRQFFDTDEDTWLFCQLLGVTSAGQRPRPNLEHAIDAFTSIKSGRFDGLMERAKKAIDDGTFVNDTRWLDKNDMLPKGSWNAASTGEPANYGKNSPAVLQVMLDRWAGSHPLKTWDYASNFSEGKTLTAVIDMWAARAARRALGGQRIAPMSEGAVSDPEYKVVQEAMHRLAKETGEGPDDIQALLWFAEKNHWKESGFTNKLATEKGDIRPLLEHVKKNGKQLTLDTSQFPDNLKYDWELEQKYGKKEWGRMKKEKKSLAESSVE